MEETGFVYFINHDLNKGVIEDVFAKSEKFFQLPADVKNKYKKGNAAENFHGFTATEEERLGFIGGTYNDTSVLDFKEAFDIWGIFAQENSNFPDEILGLKDTVDLFRASFVELASKLLYAIATFLNLEDKEFFSKQHQAFFENPTVKSQNVIRLNYYFPINPERILNINRDGIRLAEHCDLGSLSFLIQDDVGGLEVKIPTGEWIPVPPIPDSIVLNLGYVMEVWSGGNLLATPHRVRVIQDKSTIARQSAVLLLQPDGAVKFSPVVSNVKAGWVPSIGHDPNVSHFEMLSNIIRNVTKK